MKIIRWQGWPKGETTCLPPMWPGFDFRTRGHTWIEFVGSLLCYERFSAGYSGFCGGPQGTCCKLKRLLQINKSCCNFIKVAAIL